PDDDRRRGGAVAEERPRGWHTRDSHQSLQLGQNLGEHRRLCAPRRQLHDGRDRLATPLGRRALVRLPDRGCPVMPFTNLSLLTTRLPPLVCILRIDRAI